MGGSENTQAWEMGGEGGGGFACWRVGHRTALVGGIGVLDVWAASWGEVGVPLGNLA